MFSTVTTGSIHGIGCILTQVEVDIVKTMPAFDMVGMLSSEVKEAKESIAAFRADKDAYKESLTDK